MFLVLSFSSAIPSRSSSLTTKNPNQPNFGISQAVPPASRRWRNAPRNSGRRRKKIQGTSRRSESHFLKQQSTWPLTVGNRTVQPGSTAAVADYPTSCQNFPTGIRKSTHIWLESFTRWKRNPNASPSAKPTRLRKKKTRRKKRKAGTSQTHITRIGRLSCSELSRSSNSTKGTKRVNKYPRR